MSANIGTGLTKTFCLCSLNDLNIIFQRDLSLPSRPCLVLSCSILNSCLSYLPYYHSPHQRHIYLHLPLLKCLIVLITALINQEHRSQSKYRKTSPHFSHDKVYIRLQWQIITFARNILSYHDMSYIQGMDLVN